MTRDWYLGHWGKDESYDENDKAYWRKAGETEWSKNFGGEVGDHIDPFIVAADLTQLRQGSKKVRAYVNKHVAHFDAGGISGPPGAPGKKEIELPTLNEVHDAIAEKPTSVGLANSATLPRPEALPVSGIPRRC